MIKKIDIENYGIFKDFIWNDKISSNYEFKKLNIIYGRNYSGKTTLSRLLRSIENKTLHHDYYDPKFTFTLDNGATIDQNNIFDNNIEICVYNTDFVKDNLNWLYNADGTIKPFAILGKTNIEVEKKIREFNNKLGDNPPDNIEDIDVKKYKKGLYFELQEKEKEFNTIENEYKTKNNLIEKKLKDKANNDIKKNTLYNDVNYNIAKIKKDIETVNTQKAVKLSDEDIVQYKKLIKEETKQDIVELPEKKPNFEKYYNETKELLKRQIKPSETIQDLINDSVLQEWVRQGRNLHENKRNICAFCGNPIDDKLWDKLDKHFNKESETLRKEITDKIEELKKAKNGLDSFIKFNEKDFYSQIENDVKKLLNEWGTLKAKYAENIEKLIKLLELREKNIFQVLEAENIENLSDKILKFFQDINILINNHNTKTKTLNDDQKKAIEKLRLNEVARFIEDIDHDKKKKELEQIKKKEKIIEGKKNDIASKIDEYIEEIRKLEIQLNDESRGAELINEYLEKFFGHNGFKLASIEDNSGAKYKIQRNGIDAKNLSEGECSLVSFCYFIAKIKDKLNDNSRQIILYIDDPISSLDNNHIFFVFSLIESMITKEKKYKQFFISTHNLDFLKYIKRLTTSKEELAHFIIEVEQKQNDKRSTIRLMPKHLKDYTTEFNYLFNEIYKLYKAPRGGRAQQIENTYNKFYNIPNNIRKFLEYYLFYKYPNSSSPLENLEKLFDGNIPSLLNRIVNEFSHLTYIDRGWNPMDVSEIEECVKIVIEKIKEKDNEQFEALKSSIGEE